MAMVSPIRSVLSQINKDLPMANIATMDQIRADSVTQPRLESLLFGLFGGLAGCGKREKEMSRLRFSPVSAIL
jgi:hypothetical protein